jgi:hypothetical protein
MEYGPAEGGDRIGVGAPCPWAPREVLGQEEVANGIFHRRRHNTS